MNTFAYNLAYQRKILSKQHKNDRYTIKAILVRLERLFQTREYLIMPGKYRSNGKNNSSQSYEFVNVSLSRSEQAAVESWSTETSPDYGIILDDLISNGYSIKISWSDYNDCFTASLSCSDKDDPNYLKILTGRAGSAYSALDVLLYKHLVFCEGGTWSTEQSSDNWG